MRQSNVLTQKKRWQPVLPDRPHAESTGLLASWVLQLSFLEYRTMPLSEKGILYLCSTDLNNRIVLRASGQHCAFPRLINLVNVEVEGFPVGIVEVVTRTSNIRLIRNQPVPYIRAGYIAFFLPSLRRSNVMSLSYRGRARTHSKRTIEGHWNSGERGSSKMEHSTVEIS